MGRRQDKGHNDFPKQAYVIGDTPKNLPWMSVLDPQFPARIPPLFSATDDELKMVFWEKLQQAGQDFLSLWQHQGLYIEKEFAKKDAGVFHPLIIRMRQTIKEWQQELLDLRVLRVFEEPWSQGLPFQPVTVPKSAQLYAVTYENQGLLTPPDMIGRMIGKHKVSLDYWYVPILLTMGQEEQGQKEWRWFEKGPCATKKLFEN